MILVAGPRLSPDSFPQHGRPRGAALRAQPVRAPRVLRPRAGAGRPEHLHGAGRDAPAVPQLPAAAALRADRARAPAARELRRRPRRRLRRAHARGAGRRTRSRRCTRRCATSRSRPTARRAPRGASPRCWRTAGGCAPRLVLNRYALRRNLVQPTKRSLSWRGFVALLYGIVAYVFFACTFSTRSASSATSFVPKTIDSGAPVPLVEALVVNLALLGLFAVQHSVMARRGFKRWWTRIVPPAVERSTYVLAASARARAAALAVAADRRAGDLERSRTRPPCRRSGPCSGSAGRILLLATFLINHFELFGLRQVFARLVGREIPEAEFSTPFLYRYVRHPIYLGFVLGVLGHAGHERRAPAVRRRRDRLHPGRHLVRGTRPGPPVRRPVPALPRAGRDAAALAVKPDASRVGEARGRRQGAVAVCAHATGP